MYLEGFDVIFCCGNFNIREIKFSLFVFFLLFCILFGFGRQGGRYFVLVFVYVFFLSRQDFVLFRNISSSSSQGYRGEGRSQFYEGRIGWGQSFIQILGILRWVLQQVIRGRYFGVRVFGLTLGLGVFFRFGRSFLEVLRGRYGCGYVSWVVFGKKISRYRCIVF